MIKILRSAIETFFVKWFYPDYDEEGYKVWKHLDASLPEVDEYESGKVRLDAFKKAADNLDYVEYCFLKVWLKKHSDFMRKREFESNEYKAQQHCQKWSRIFREHYDVLD